MRFLLGRDGSISIIRVGTLAAILGIVLVLGGIVLFLIDRASHQVPLSIEPFPGAALWYEQPRAENSRAVVYQVVGATAEDVAAYYQRKLQEFDTSTQETCLRLPTVGNFADFDKGEPNIPPYQFSCMFDRSGFQITQYTRVNIQPGIASLQTEGKVIIEYEQYWQR